MQIHMVIKTSKPFDEWVNTNVAPYLAKAKADLYAAELNKKRSESELNDYLEYVVETHDIAY